MIIWGKAIVVEAIILGGGNYKKTTKNIIKNTRSLVISVGCLHGCAERNDESADSLIDSVVVF